MSSHGAQQELSFMYFPQDYRWSHGVLIAPGRHFTSGGEGDVKSAGAARLLR